MKQTDVLFIKKKLIAGFKVEKIKAYLCNRYDEEEIDSFIKSTSKTLGIKTKKPKKEKAEDE